ncbi:hypothetical protein KC19_12G027600 [Ceratodon purpureus]|uniref:CRM domain-containing protein n=1 Tax=Ceratodon purpureus TaxID=3225 RepID=A0A8T0G5B0_CERPU|nr:hypothetical protein KC19_12G027600 [Ceratodon purpureus]
MALGFTINPTYNSLCGLDLPCFHTSSLGSLISHRPVLKRVHLPWRYHSPRQPRVSVHASSLWKQQGSVNEESNEGNSSSTFELSSVFIDILKQRSESGFSNDVVELESNGSGSDSFVRRRGGGYVEDETDYETSGSSSDIEGEDWLWSGGERRDSRTRDLDEDSGPSRNAAMGHRRGDRLGGPKLTIAKSYPSIPAKFSKYTRWKNANRGQSRSVKVKQQLKENNLQNQQYFKEKSVFFKDFVSPVIKPEQPCQFSYSEHPSVPPIGFREPLYSPFGPENMARPWTGKRPYEPRKGIPHPEFDSFKLPPAAMTKARFVQPPGPFVEGTGPKLGRTREEILGEPLSNDEVRELVAEACVERRQLDLGKDGLTHNMLDLLHRHWKRRRVCRIKCYGVPTVDMSNLCRVIEDKSGGKIIRRSKSMLYVFRGRNYNWATRPKIPLMLWKPPAPVYPPVVQRVPEGLSVEEAENLRMLGRRAHCLCRLKKAGMYQHLVKMVKDAFKNDEVVKVDCRELDRSDMKKIGAKLRDLVPCVPISCDRHFMMLWKGSKLHDESQKGTEVDTSGAEKIGSQGHIDSEFIHYEPRSDYKSEDNELQEQLYANMSDTTDLTSEKESSSDYEDRVNCNTNTRETADINIVLEEPEKAIVMGGAKSGDQVKKLAVSNETRDMNVTAVLGSDEAVLEFDRLWEEAIKSTETVVLDESEAGLENVLETVESHKSDNQSWEFTLKSWDKNPSEPDNESSERDEGVDEDGSTLGTWEVTRFSTGTEVDEYEEDGEQLEEIRKAEESLPSSSTDITVPQDEFKRLCALRLKIRGWMKIGTQGITRGIVKSIHGKWLVSEIAKVRCIVPGCNMREIHEDLERLTGGIVIWREGPAVVIYRGKDYVPGWMRKFEEREEAYRERLQSLGLDEDDDRMQRDGELQTSKMGEIDVDELLDDLGPEYEDWTEGGRVPVDGDLLLPPNSGFKSPFRRLPYGVRPRLTNFEMTEMRHLARKLPPDFVIGKRRGLEGLASAIVKLWEKSETAKVVMKRGISRIDNDRMTAELLRLTGGDLIARNMSYIALFRGNDFLPPAVKDTLEENDRAATSLLEDEERARLAGFRNASRIIDAPLKPSNAGTLAELLEEEARWNPWENSMDCSNQMILARKAARDQALQRMHRITNAVSQKIARAERELQNINLKMRPKDPIVDREQISEEEMYTLRKIGLRMKPFLLLGRREVFGGIIENMHLNWKWRELVKIIVKKSYFMYREKDEVDKIARMLETESGGILVGICTIPVGAAIIVYRGKNYQRPIDGISLEGLPDGLRPRGLLTKRQAWQRFNQKRRKLSLERHLRKLERDFDILRTDLMKLEEQDMNLDNEGGNTGA